jgi:hypothetical protein
MSYETYEDDCPGCRPVLLDTRTGKQIPDDNPMMQVVLTLFEQLTLTEKQAWHRFTCQNSSAPADLKAVAMFQARIEAALK